MAHAHQADLELLQTAARSRALPVLARVLARVAAVWAVWATRHRTRSHLKDVPPELLRDVGLTDAQAEREYLKRFWMP